jgi:hypothetical protein
MLRAGSASSSARHRADAAGMVRMGRGRRRHGDCAAARPAVHSGPILARERFGSHGCGATRREPVGTSRGSNDPARSRGTSSPRLAPRRRPRSPASWGVVPLREFGSPRPAGSPFSYPQVLSQLSRQATLQDSLDHLRQEPARPSQRQPDPVHPIHQVIEQARIDHLVDDLTSRALRPRRRAHLHTKWIHPLLIIGHGHYRLPQCGLDDPARGCRVGDHD